jgi:Flp pilus assembly protein TadD
MEAKGILLLEKGEFYAAQEILNKALEQDASRWQIVNCLGIALETQGKIKEALDYYRIAKELSHNNYVVLNNIALALAKLKDYDEALIVIDQALTQSSQESIIKKLSLNKALILSLAGQHSSAIEIAKKYLTDEEVKDNELFYSILKQSTL